MLRRIARPLLASVFIADGVRAIARPSEELDHLPHAEEGLEKAGEALPVTLTPHQIVRVLGVTKVGAGLALAFGVLPRVAASLLTVLQVPTAFSRNPFWQQQGKQRRESLVGLARDGAILGGLLLAVVDTDGKPSLAWRAEHAAAQVKQDAKRTAELAKRDAKRTAELAKRDATRVAKRATKDARRAAKDAGQAAQHAVHDAAKDLSHAAEMTTASLKHGAESLAKDAAHTAESTVTAAELGVAKLEVAAERAGRKTRRAARRASKQAKQAAREVKAKLA